MFVGNSQSYKKIIINIKCIDEENVLKFKNGNSGHNLRTKSYRFSNSGESCKLIR